MKNNLSQTDKAWIKGYFCGVEAGQLSLLDEIEKLKNPYKNLRGQLLPWEKKITILKI